MDWMGLKMAVLLRRQAGLSQGLKMTFFVAQVWQTGPLVFSQPGPKSLFAQRLFVQRFLPGQIIVKCLAHQGAVCGASRARKGGKLAQVNFRQINLRALHNGVN